MPSSLTDVLDRDVHPYFPTDLTAGLPAVSPSITGADAPSLLLFECPLGADCASVDLSVGYGKGALSIPGDLPRDPVWAGLARFAPLWAAGGTAFDAVTMVGLEWDASARTSAPSVFFALHQNGVIAAADPAQTRAALSALVRDIEPLFDWAFPAATRDALMQVIATLPAGYELPYLGLMAPRPDQPVRLGLRPTTPQGILDLLDRLGWAGDTQMVSDVLERYCEPGARPPVLAGDLVDGALQPRLGLEFITAENGRRNPDGFDRLFERLVAHGLCSARSREAVRSWLHTPERGASPLEVFLGSGHPAERRVSHVKLTLDRGALAAKGYLTCLP